jgi:uncharacterized membrane protein YeaQ/YmgE (transglycosylase-associated protein family)
MNCLYVILVLIVLGAIGYVIDLIVPGKMPMGWIGGVVSAIIGGIIGGWLLGQWGPAITFDLGGSTYTLSIIPALLGGIILAVIVRFAMRMMNQNTTT